MGMNLFLVSLGVLFAASIVGYLVVRGRAEQWQPAGSSDLPSQLWLSTVALLTSSMTIHSALRAVRLGRSRRVYHALLATLVLGFVFLGLQVVAWLDFVAAGVTAGSSLYAFTFYVFTALHGFHVVGGLIPLGVTAWQARQGKYSAGSHAGIVYVSMYWHFLDAVWIVLFVLMMV